MVPWPIALLALFYGVIATASAASAWRIFTGMSQQVLIWPVGWFAVSAAAMCGLALLRPWGRRLAVGTFVALVVVTLAVAGVMVTSGRPIGALLCAFFAGVYVLAIRYLQRPTTKAYFGSSEYGMRNSE